MPDPYVIHIKKNPTREGHEANHVRKIAQETGLGRGDLKALAKHLTQINLGSCDDTAWTPSKLTKIFDEFGWPPGCELPAVAPVPAAKTVATREPGAHVPTISPAPAISVVPPERGGPAVRPKFKGDPLNKCDVRIRINRPLWRAAMKKASAGKAAGGDRAITGGHAAGLITYALWLYVDRDPALLDDGSDKPAPVPAPTHNRYNLFPHEINMEGEQ